VYLYIIVTNFLLSLTVKEFWKSVNTWWSYGHELGVLFFDSRCSAADITTPRDASLLPPLPWPFVTSDMTRLGVGQATCVFLMCRQWADKPRFLKTVVTVMLIRKAITKRFLRLTFWLVVCLLILIWAIRSTSLLLSSASSSLFCYVRFILFSLLSQQL